MQNVWLTKKRIKKILSSSNIRVIYYLESNTLKLRHFSDHPFKAPFSFKADENMTIVEIHLIVSSGGSILMSSNRINLGKGETINVDFSKFYIEGYSIEEIFK